jgi:3-methyladenine DNA glycosylase AlkD
MHEMTAPNVEQLRRLQEALNARSTEKSREFWSKYLKGSAAFRGVPMAGVRKVVHAWWMQESLADLTAAAQTKVALRLFEEEPTEDKLAGVLALSEILLPHLSKKNLPSFARLFAKGRIADWNLCDWFCVKVLGKMVEHVDEPDDLAEAISDWRSSKPLWQRRATCVAFVNHAKHGDERMPGLPALILRNADALVRDPERFAQTGVGWVLRELSIAKREAVVAVAEEHVERLSREGMKYIVEKMPTAEKKRLLAMHAERPGWPPTTGRESRSGTLRPRRRRGSSAPERR